VYLTHYKWIKPHGFFLLTWTVGNSRWYVRFVWWA
jgi:hypothetical protein